MAKVVLGKIFSGDGSGERGVIIRYIIYPP